MQATEYLIKRTEDGVRLYGQHGDQLLEITPADSLSVAEYSPSGFEVGYSGLGPSQLALAILLDVSEGMAPDHREVALEHHRAFKCGFLAGTQVPLGGELRLSRDEVMRWLCQHISRQECGS